MPASESCLIARSERTRRSLTSADAHIHLRSAYLTMMEAAWRYDNGLDRSGKLSEIPRADAAFTAADRAVQTYGGLGYATEHQVERFWRGTTATPGAGEPRNVVELIAQTGLFPRYRSSLREMTVRSPMRSTRLRPTSSPLGQVRDARYLDRVQRCQQPCGCD